MIVYDSTPKHDDILEEIALVWWGVRHSIC